MKIFLNKQNLSHSFLKKKHCVHTSVSTGAEFSSQLCLSNEMLELINFHVQ